MKRFIQHAVIIGVCLSGSLASASPWLTDYESAKAQAAATKRPILINFTGSDWCPACIRLRREVLDHPEFTAYASSSLVLLELDFPRTRTQSASVQQANQKLAQQFGVTHFPSMFLADSQGHPRKRLSGGGSPSQFVQLLRESVAPGAVRTPEKAKVGDAPSSAKEAPLFAGASTKPPTIYTNLVLKSITGGPNRRFALINSETMAAGESATVRLGNEKVTVHCIDIRNESVTVKVTGDKNPRELRLSDIR